MVAAHAPDLGRCQFLVGSDGDDGAGILMGMGAGGLAINMSMGSISLPIIPPKKVQFGVMINAQGQRFVNEDSYYGRLGEYVMYRQEGRAWLVLDEKCFERPEVPREIVAVGESTAEIESALKLPPGSFAATVEFYNRHAERGEDPLFHKSREYLAPLEPPFAGARLLRRHVVLRVVHARRAAHDDRRRGDDAGRRIVPGLFAAGRTSAGLAAPGYSSGISLGTAATSAGVRGGRSPRPDPSWALMFGQAETRSP
jgi:hypothetical protein